MAWNTPGYIIRIITLLPLLVLIILPFQCSDYCCVFSVLIIAKLYDALNVYMILNPNHISYCIGTSS